MLQAGELSVLPVRGHPSGMALINAQTSIPPGQTREEIFEYLEQPEDEMPWPDVIAVRSVTVTDAAGRQREIHPYRGGPPGT